MFKVNNRNTRTGCEIFSKLTIKIPERLFNTITPKTYKNFKSTFELTLGKRKFGNLHAYFI